MILTITDIKRIPLNKDSVRTCELAGERIAIRTVTTLASAGDCGDGPGLHVDSTNDVVLGIGNVEHAFGICHAFRTVQRVSWSTEFGAEGGTTVAGITQFPRPRYRFRRRLATSMEKTLFPSRRIRYMVPSGAISIDRGPATGAASREASSSVLPRSPFQQRCDDSRLRIDSANAIVHDVANIDIVGPIQRNAVRLGQLRLICRTAIAAEATHAGARGGRNHFRFHVDISAPRDCRVPRHRCFPLYRTALHGAR